jgi:protein-S-isoprenylcysteine O-methyltransferase Ste14
MLKLKIPPPVYALIVAAFMWLLHDFFPVYQWVDVPWNKIGFVFIALGVSLDLFAVGLFLKAKTTINPLRPDNSQNIVETGLYRYTRNPMYLGMLWVLTGISIWFGSVSVLLGLPMFVLLITTQQIIPEEQTLTKKFGQSYLDYKHRVRRWL